MAISRTQSKLLVGGLFGVFILAVAFFMRSDGNFETLPETAHKDETAPVPAQTAGGAPADGSTNAAAALAAAVPDAAVTPGSQFVLQKFHRSEVKNGKKVWEVSAERGEYHPQTNTAEVEQALVSLYREETPVIIRATKANLILEGTALARAEAFGEVLVTSEKQGTLATSHATFDKTTNTITSEAPVAISMPQLTLRGVGLQANLDSKEFVLKSEVESVLIPKSDKPGATADPSEETAGAEKKP